MERLLDIGEVSDRSGVSASGLRYYEKRGIIRSVARNGLRRQFEPVVLEELALVTLAKSAGFTLDDVAAILPRAPDTALPRDAIRARANAVEQEAARLTVLARMLRHIAACPEDNHFDCPRFQTLLKRATKRAARMRT